MFGASSQVFSDAAGKWPSRTGTAALHDVDFDGDLDAVVGNRLWLNTGLGQFVEMNNRRTAMQSHLEIWTVTGISIFLPREKAVIRFDSTMVKTSLLKTAGRLVTATRTFVTVATR